MMRRCVLEFMLLILLTLLLENDETRMSNDEGIQSVLRWPRRRAPFLRAGRVALPRPWAIEVNRPYLRPRFASLWRDAIG